MVGGDDVDATVIDGAQQGVAVVGGLYGRIAFGQAAGQGHRFVVKQQVVGACLGCHTLVGQGTGGEESKLVGGGDVHQVETRAGLAGQLYGVAGGDRACLARAQDVMQPHRYAARVFPFQGLARRGYYLLALGVAGYHSLE